MGLATTVQNVSTRERFFMLPIMFYKSTGGLPQPVIFEKAGDTLDLNRIDIPSYVQGMQHPAMRELVEYGSVRLIQVDVTERIEQELRAEQAKYSGGQPAVPSGSPHGGETQIVTLEPGLHVAVGAGGFPVEAKAELPPVVDVITAGAKLEEAPVEPETLAGAPVAVTEVAVSEPSWKDGLTFDQQKAFISACKDKALLEEIIADDSESLKIKKLAKEALAKLKA